MQLKTGKRPDDLQVSSFSAFAQYVHTVYAQCIWQFRSFGKVEKAYST